MRHINERGIEIVKSFEGISVKPYLCPANVWTVGYGATRSSTGGPIGLDMEPISETEAEALLIRDLESSEEWVRRLIKTTLTENQYSALTSFTFNVGAGALQRSTLRMKLNRGEYQGAANEFLKWRMAGGRILAELVRRRAAERALFLL
jgi:lysozyme